MTVDNPSVRLPRLIGTRASARVLIADLSEKLDEVDLFARASTVCTYQVVDEIVHELVVLRGARLHVHGATDELQSYLAEAAEVHGVVDKIIHATSRPSLGAQP